MRKITNNDVSSLWRQLNYKTSIKYLVNTYIREYDLSKANINALLYTNRISKEEYNKFLVMDKKDREVSIGLMIRNDRSIYTDIQKGIIEAKRKLFLSNSIEDFEVVSIKNDAVFTHGRLLQIREFPPFDFKIKNEYTIYLQLQELEVYYGDSIDQCTGDIITNLDVKGISDSNLLLHQNGMLDLICETCYRIQRERIEDTMSWISQMYEKFIKRELPKEYYRNFDAFSMYKVHTFTRIASMIDIDDSLVPVIDINRNLSIFRDLVSIVSDIYRMKIR